jgi:hypothetical protein
MQKPLFFKGFCGLFVLANRRYRPLSHLSKLLQLFDLHHFYSTARFPCTTDAMRAVAGTLYPSRSWPQ